MEKSIQRIEQHRDKLRAHKSKLFQRIADILTVILEQYSTFGTLPYVREIAESTGQPEEKVRNLINGLKKKGILYRSATSADRYGRTYHVLPIWLQLHRHGTLLSMLEVGEKIKGRFSDGSKVAYISGVFGKNPKKNTT